MARLILSEQQLRRHTGALELAQSSTMARRGGWALFAGAATGGWPGAGSDEVTDCGGRTGAYAGAKQRCPSPSTALPSPAPSDVSDCETASMEDAERTTLIVRQVPRDVSRQAVIQALADQGFGADVDFLYCPLDYVSKKGFGYVLLNFASPAAALRFRERFQGQPGSWLSPQHGNCLDIVWAKGDNRQGLQANLDRYRNSPVMHSIVPDEFKPIALWRGRRVAFAKATEKLEAPSKLPRSVWKAWTEEKKRLAGKAPEKVVALGSRAAAADTSVPAAATRARLCWDHRFGLAITLNPGFRGPPGLPLPPHLQLL